MKKDGDILGFFMNRKGQVTIFIIVAILIVGIAVLVYVLIPRAETGAVFDAKNPQAFIQNCLENDLENTVETLSAQGGSLNPEFYFTYNNINIEYLCYTSENYVTCVVQQPLLKQHIESEIKTALAEKVSTCFANLEENYRIDGYGVELQTGKTEVELLPKRVVMNFNDYILTVTKGETARYDGLNVVLNNNLYELTSIAKSIIEWEATVGEADPRIYMTYYSDLKVEKNLRDEGTRIYIITDRNTGNKFQFASRSLVFLPGH